MRSIFTYRSDQEKTVPDGRLHRTGDGESGRRGTHRDGPLVKPRPQGVTLCGANELRSARHGSPGATHPCVARTADIIRIDTRGKLQ